MVRKELKEYVTYPPPWRDNLGGGTLNPVYGVPDFFIKDKIKIKISFEEIIEKFPNYNLSHRDRMRPEFYIFAQILSFISQDGLIFFLFGEPENKNTHVWQIYFDDNTKYPPNIKNARKETTAFKRWLLKRI